MPGKLTSFAQNYVIQYILEYGPEEEKGVILSMLQGWILQFSRHKHASNVCEMAIVHSPPHIRHRLIDEILVMVHGFPIGVWQMIHDPYGSK
jgi:pumilio RNA-binding family